MITEELVENFENITGFDLDAWLGSFDDFSQNYYQDIYNYYAGVVKQPNTLAFEKLNNLLQGASYIDSLIQINAGAFTDSKNWDFLAYLEEIFIKLKSASKLYKYLRSNKDEKSYILNGYQTNYYAAKYERPEDIVAKTGSLNPQEDWIDLAVKNNLEELNYKYSGAYTIQLNIDLQSQAGTGAVLSVVGDTTGEKIMGKDFDRKIYVLNNDLKKLSYKETFLQAIDIIVTLVKGSVPESPKLGISRNLIGSNITVLRFPILIRELEELFATDDTIQSISIGDVITEEDAVYLNIFVRSAYIATEKKIKVS